MAVRDLSVAAIAAAFALILLIFSTHLPLGTALRMGPGFVPRAVAFGLIFVAAGLALRGLLALRRRARPAAVEAPVHWRGTASIGVSVLAFATLIQPIGLLASAVITVFVASLAQEGDGARQRVLLAGGLAAVAGAVFAYGLGLPLPILPTVL